MFPSDVGGSDPVFARIAQQGNAADEFVKGPDVAPFGSGSIKFTTTGANDHLFLYNYDWGTFDLDSGTESNDGVALTDITELAYSTYTNDDSLVPALKMELDPDGPGASGGDDYVTLNFEPYYNNTVVPAEWQTWDVLTADAGV